MKIKVIFCHVQVKLLNNILIVEEKILNFFEIIIYTLDSKLLIFNYTSKFKVYNLKIKVNQIDKLFIFKII